MNAAVRIIAFVFTASTLAAQPELTFSYGASTWGGRITIGAHASHSIAGTTLLPDKRADLGATFEHRVNLNGKNFQAFYVQGDLDARVQTTLGLVNGRAQSIVTQSLTLAGLVRVGTLTMLRSTALREQLDVVIPTQTFGDDTVVVSMNGPYFARITIAGMADVRATLGPALSRTEASMSFDFRGNTEGRVVMAVASGLTQVRAVGVLDYADPTSTGTVSTDFQRPFRSVCWALGPVTLVLDAVGLDNGFFGLFRGEQRGIVVRSQETLPSGCMQLL